MTSAAPPAPVPTPLSDLPDVDVRLVAVDMDGTLLDGEHEVDPEFWPVLAEMTRRGIVLCPASGRQQATLLAQFERVAGDLVVIAENGSLVTHGDRLLHVQTLDRPTADDVVRRVRRLAADGVAVGAVLCGVRSAYVERTDGPFRAEADRYYRLLTQVEDLLAVEDDVLKVAVFQDTGNAQDLAYPPLADLAATHQVVVSGAHWVDVMDRATSKGAALRHVQAALGVTREQTVAFGDFLNDVELLDAAGLPVAMANAHPDLLARASVVAPSNTEHGVARVLGALLAR